MNNRCAKFKTKPLEYLDLMERVYSGAAATRKHVWTSIEIRDKDADATNADTNIGPLSVGTPLHLGNDTVGENVVDSSLFDNALPHSNVDGLATTKVASGQPSILWQVAWTTLWRLLANKAGN